MRWIGLLAFLAAGCTAQSAPDSGAFSVDSRQGVKKVLVQPGATGEHVAWCPSDMFGVSGGFSLPSNSQSFAVTSSMPFGGRWRVTVRNITATPQALELIVYITCVKP